MTRETKTTRNENERRESITRPLSCFLKERENMKKQSKIDDCNTGKMGDCNTVEG